MEEDSVTSVRSLERGLRLLQAMNRSPHASVTLLAREIGIPRSTAYRLLDTLVRLGFVTSTVGGYALARNVRTLSDGFIDEAWLEIAWREMVELSKALIWPTSLATSEAATMVLRRTTHELSTMSIDYGMAGRRFPITETAAGRVYLAFCPPAERQLILSMPAAHAVAPTQLDHTLLEERLVKIRERGFDTRVGGVVERTASLSVPVMVDERVVCSIAIIFIASAMPIERAIEQFEQPMKSMAARISQSVASLANAPA